MPDAPGLIRRIRAARVYDVAVRTPLDLMPRLSARLGRPVYVKREDLQPVNASHSRMWDCLPMAPQ